MQTTTTPKTLACAVLTISNTRSANDDGSGDLLCSLLQAEGHRVLRRDIVADDIYQLRKAFSDLIADPALQVILSSGGTGFARHNCVPQAVPVLFDEAVPGFGELFRQLSFADVGSATVQSRSLAGLANGKLICCLPGSERAVQLGWDGILRAQLDSRTKPCNFASQL